MSTENFAALPMPNFGPPPPIPTSEPQASLTDVGRRTSHLVEGTIVGGETKATPRLSDHKAIPLDTNEVSKLVEDLNAVVSQIMTSTPPDDKLAEQPIKEFNEFSNQLNQVIPPRKEVKTEEAREETQAPVSDNKPKGYQYEVMPSITNLRSTTPSSENKEGIASKRKHYCQGLNLDKVWSCAVAVGSWFVGIIKSAGSNVASLAEVLRNLSNSKAESSNATLTKTASSTLSVYTGEVASDRPPAAKEVIKKFIQEGELSKLPKPISYSVFSDIAYKKARTDLDNLCSQLGGKKVKDQVTLYFTPPPIKADGWDFDPPDKSPLDKLPDNTLLQLNESFQMTAGELKAEQQSTYVSYIDGAETEKGKGAEKSTVKLDASLLSGMLKNGVQNAEELTLARYRCVVSDIHLIREGNGNPIQRTPEEPLAKFRMCNISAPNLMDERDRKHFIDEKNNLKTEEYKREMKKILMHAMSNGKEGGVIVLNGIGQGAYLPGGPVRQEAHKAFAAALKEVVTDPTLAGFEGFVFSDVNENLLGIVRDANIPSDRLTIASKNPLDIANAGAKQGIPMTVINPGDPSTIPSQQFLISGHKAGDEINGAMTTFVHTQYPTLNPDKIMNPENYRKFEYNEER